jgi:hypothetical protein
MIVTYLKALSLLLPGITGENQQRSQSQQFVLWQKFTATSTRKPDYRYFEISLGFLVCCF